MGCFCSKEDEEVPNRSNSRVTRNVHEEIRVNTLVLNQNYTLPQRCEITPVIEHNVVRPQSTSVITYSNKLQTRNNVVVPKAKPTSLKSIEGPKFNSTRQNNNARPRFGEFECNKCGRFWESRLCWPGKYQNCKKCHKPVFPHSHRQLLSSDLSDDKENRRSHPKDLCQMCQTLGHYCNDFNKVYKRKLYSQSKSNRGKYKRE